MTIRWVGQTVLVWGRRIWQVGLLTAIAMLGNALGTWLHLPAIPGSLLGLVLLYGALHLRWVPLRLVEDGADWLLKHQLLFFVPSAVGILQYTGLLRAAGWRIFTVIGASTVVVMAATGFTIDGLHRIQEKGKRRANLG